MGYYKHWTENLKTGNPRAEDPRQRDPGTRDVKSKDWGHKDQSVEGRVLLQQKYNMQYAI